MNVSFFMNRATAFWAVALPFLFSSCAMAPPAQPRVNSLVVAQKISQADQALGDDPKIYGRNNELLYWLDRGMVEQCAGRFEDSIYSFSQAQRKYDELYTKSITKMANAWALNDYAAPYRGEDYEYTLINIFQAINYLMIDDYNEALVEARDMDSKLNLINSLYGGKNIYKEDAFGRFFMGLLYEATGSTQDVNDAFISYAKAFEIYKKDEGKFFTFEIPDLLKENLLTTARFMGDEQYNRYRLEFPDVPMTTLQDKQKKAEVYLIQYTGFIPVKVSGVVPIAVDPRHITQIAFPRYMSRYSEIASSEFLGSKSDQLSYVQPTFIGQDIATLAEKVLESRKAQILTKAIIRPLAKYAAERVVEEKIKDKWGEGAALGFDILSSIFNLTTERADLRSWQTLPAQIRIARLLLEPGEYDFFIQTYDAEHRMLNKLNLGRAALKAGQKKFFLFRNYR